MKSKLLLLITLLALAISAHPQANSNASSVIFTVLHQFTGNVDGATPLAGITIDGTGTLYGTTSAGGGEGFGNVYRLVPAGNTWNFNLLYTFQGLTQWSQDGGAPYARVTIGPDGALYGTTRIGGNGDGCRELHGCGTVFKLQPQFSGEWKETILHEFGLYDGDHPWYGDVVFDRNGNLYGATILGGAYLHGAVYQLAPNNGAWTHKVVHSFTDADGSMPLAGPTFDANGSLYGNTSAGGSSGMGTVYRLMPAALNWQTTVVHHFQGSDGMTPSSGVVLDQAGNLYGVTQAGGLIGAGVAYQLALRAPGSWDINPLYGFRGTGLQGTYRTLTMDKAGNLYGTTATEGAYQKGSVFKLTLVNVQWVYTTLHDFTGGNDGAYPYGTLSFDANGNIYGTAEYGGVYGYGVVFKIKP